MKPPTLKHVHSAPIYGKAAELEMKSPQNHQTLVTFNENEVHDHRDRATTDNELGFTSPQSISNEMEFLDNYNDFNNDEFIKNNDGMAINIASYNYDSDEDNNNNHHHHSSNNNNNNILNDLDAGISGDISGYDNDNEINNSRKIRKNSINSSKNSRSSNNNNNNIINNNTNNNSNNNNNNNNNNTRNMKNKKFRKRPKTSTSSKIRRNTTSTHNNNGKNFKSMTSVPSIETMFRTKSTADLHASSSSKSKKHGLGLPLKSPKLLGKSPRFFSSKKPKTAKISSRSHPRNGMGMGMGMGMNRNDGLGMGNVFGEVSRNPFETKNDNNGGKRHSEPLDGQLPINQPTMKQNAKTVGSLFTVHSNGSVNSGPHSNNSGGNSSGTKPSKFLRQMTNPNLSSMATYLLV